MILVILGLCIIGGLTIGSAINHALHAYSVRTSIPTLSAVHHVKYSTIVD